jgi:hypothetical protein
VGVLLVTPVLAQQPPSPPAEALELYHVHVVKAAAGKLSDLIDAYSPGPAARPGDPQVAPIVLRHREGGEWDLLVITPLGKDHSLNADPPPPEVQAFNQRIIPITDWHGDTFAVGPPWESVQKAILPARRAQTVYVVTDLRALTGHRPQLRQTLDRIGQQASGRSALFAHVEGAPWNFLTITRYDSWADLGQQQTGQPSQPLDNSLDLRRDMAVQHDTVATYVGGGEARK